jgi:hypothetical protein
MDPLVIKLKEDDLLSLWAAIVDDDGSEALAFLRDRILPQIPAQGKAACDSSRLNPYLMNRKI